MTATPVTVAAAFSTLLRINLGRDVMAEVVRLNATPDYSGCCATHNFCDANVIMLEAVATLKGVDEADVDPCDDATLDLMNQAWDIAKAEGFRACTTN